MSRKQTPSQKKDSKDAKALEPDVLEAEPDSEQELADLAADDDLIGLDSKGQDEEEEFTLLPAPATDSSITTDPLRMYLREVGRFPMLKPGEEFELGRQVRDDNSSEAAFRLVSSHLRLVVKIAMDFQRRWMQNVLDLVQEGNVGLMRAVQKFDPEKGIKFSYYASFWIKAYILKFIMDNWRLVKIGTTQAQRKLFYNLNKERQRLKALGFDADTATLSKNLNVTVEQVEEMEQRMSSNDLSLNMPLGEDSNTTRMDVLPALEPGIEATLANAEISSVLRTHLEAILPELNEKEQDILKLRLLSDQPLTLREIGEKYSITRERVRQLETRLLSKLKTHLSREIKDFSPDWINRND